MRPDLRVFTSRVARRTFVLFVICALLPVSALAVLAFRQVTSELHEQSRRQRQQESKAVAMVLLQRLLAAEAAIGATGERADKPRGAKIERPVTGVLLTTGGGPDRQLSGEMDRPPRLTPQQQARVAGGKTVLSTERDADGRVRFFLSRALDGAHPERGILHGAINRAYLWTLQDEAGLQPGVKLIVLDESGRLLFPSFGSTGSLPESVTRQAGQRTAGHFEWSDGSAQYTATHWSLFLQSNFSTPKWTIVLNQSKADVLAPIAHFKITFLLVIILTVLMVLLLSVRQIRKSLTPLEKLQEGTRRLAMGDLDMRVEVTSRDEFQDLAGSFNRMAGQLGRQFNALEMRREISAALNPNAPLDETLQACAGILARQLDLAAVGFWIVGGNDAPLELRASAETSRPEGAASVWTRMTEAMVGRIATERLPYATNSLLEEPLPLQLQQAAPEKLVAFVGHPLVVDRRVVGVAAAFGTHALDGMDLSGFGAATGDIARYIDRKRVEDALQESEVQLRQLQKMEAVGRLAGGIAHDFNNLLTVIIGNSHLLLDSLTADHPQRRPIKTIAATAERAALLTRQLLAFSRKQMLAPAVLNLNEVIAGMTEMLRRLIGESIELVFSPGAEVGTVKVDRGQIEQVIVNLVVNARDAMPQGGRITIETSSAEPAGPHAAGPAGPGPHVKLAVTDTGTGMDAHTRVRIFEPFFTTKDVGKGTGLGLATVYGIVQQSGGSISVDTEPGAGSTFTIYLPRVEDAAVSVEAASAPAGRGSETVLVVEDEAEVRTLVHAVLAEHGYLVLSAGRPGEAVRLAEGHAGPIHLLVTDMVMPEMSGPALAQQLIALRPEMAVLYMSGYSDLVVEDGPPLLQKPFTPDSVARTVRAVLDGVGRAPVPAGQ